jgi:hypothetical protein
MTDTSQPTLYVTDEELIKLLGVPVRDARAALQELDRNPASGFPRKQKLWGDRRYLPAVRAYFDRLNGLKIDASPIRRAS